MQRLYNCNNNYYSAKLGHKNTKSCIVYQAHTTCIN